MRNRGIPTPPPASAPRDSGLGRLKNTVRPSGKALPNAIPRDEEATIKAMTTEAEDGTTAGADNLPKNPATAPGSHRSNIPGGVGNLIAPPGVNVP
jgi:hypothetical protein